MRGESGEVRLTLYDAAFTRTGDGRLRTISIPRTSWQRWLLDEIDSHVLARRKRAGLKKKILCHSCGHELSPSHIEQQKIEFWARRAEMPVIVPPFRVRIEAPAVTCTACDAPNVVQRDFLRRISDAQTKILSTLA
jgi:hypothetical protein